ncbi:hypothetical protein BVI1335_500002 [Burkholderia vietnamiensis]|nr:hypothetical protein BVI1335_500002 [Burkholderia vietnamiensis]
MALESRLISKNPARRFGVRLPVRHCDAGARRTLARPLRALSRDRDKGAGELPCARKKRHLLDERFLATLFRTAGARADAPAVRDVDQTLGPGGLRCVGEHAVHRRAEPLQAGLGQEPVFGPHRRSGP